MITDPRTRFADDGFAVFRGAVDPLRTPGLVAVVERAVDALAAELGVSRERYLGSVAKWGQRNPMVAELASSVDAELRTCAEAAAGGTVERHGATLFRKSEHAAAPTHAHQDASYRHGDGSPYHLTTWLALDDADAESGALVVLCGSHLEGVGVREDFLAPDFHDRALTSDWRERATVVGARAGDVVAFDARTWHAAGAMLRPVTRRALAVRWRTQDGDRVVVPAPVVRPDVFGMDTSGAIGAAAIRRVLGAAELRPLATELTALLSARGRIPLDASAWALVERLELMLRAGAAHHAHAQDGMVWEPFRDQVLPALASLAPASAP